MGKGKGKGIASSSSPGHHTTGNQQTTGQTSTPLVPPTTTTTTAATVSPPRRCTPVGFSASNSIPAGTHCNGQAPFTLFTFVTPFRNAVAVQFTNTGAAAAGACHVTFAIHYSNGTTQTVVLGPGESTIVNVNRNLGVTSVTAACGTGGGPCAGTATVFFTECV